MRDDGSLSPPDGGIQRTYRPQVAAPVREEGMGGFKVRSSRPHRFGWSHELGVVVEAVGRRRLGPAAIRIASELALPRSAIGSWLRLAGSFKAAALQL